MLLLSNGEGASSVDDLADDLLAATQQVIDDGATTSAIHSYGEALLDMLPNEVVDALIDSGFYDDRDEIADYLAEFFWSPGSWSMNGADYLEDMQRYISLYEDSLDSDYVESLNEAFQDDLGLDLEVEEACKIELNVVYNPTEDTPTLGTLLFSVDFAGIEIDGRWHLWAAE